MSPEMCPRGTPPPENCLQGIKLLRRKFKLCLRPNMILVNYEPRNFETRNSLLLRTANKSVKGQFRAQLSI